MTIDDYIDQRNAIQLKAEAKGEDAGRVCWIKLGVANRLIEAVLNKQSRLVPGIEHEIANCLRRAQETK